MFLSDSRLVTTSGAVSQSPRTFFANTALKKSRTNISSTPRIGSARRHESSEGLVGASPARRARRASSDHVSPQPEPSMNSGR